jgi:hypothetical protein
MILSSRFKKENVELFLALPRQFHGHVVTSAHRFFRHIRNTRQREQETKAEQTVWDNGAIGAAGLPFSRL